MTTTGLTHLGPCEGSAHTAEARPQLADVFRKYATRYRRKYGDRLTQQQDRALREIEVCQGVGWRLLVVGCRKNVGRK